MRPVIALLLTLIATISQAAVVHDPEKDVYFLTDGTAVAKLSSAGKVIKRQFVRGLSAPQGMTLRGNELWIADGTALRAYDRVTGKPVALIDMKTNGATGLVDVVTADEDALYVSDASNRIFKLDRENQVSIAVENEALRSPRGLAWYNHALVVAQGEGDSLLAWQRGNELSFVGRGAGRWDDLLAMPDGTFFARSRRDGALYMLRNGAWQQWMTTAPGGIGYDQKRNALLVPGEGRKVEVRPIERLK